ncbi:hypothetical protein [Cohnella sp. WQ 127256]|uniref:hypothetical protein n=1 Tax=Cohnella sp. WQ 127256 TaxID=2938790 RepID=UPI0021196414|nr:hypothetical protein [Cohnella sp. WQ 127256]
MEQQAMHGEELPYHQQYVVQQTSLLQRIALIASLTLAFLAICGLVLLNQNAIETRADYNDQQKLIEEQRKEIASLTRSTKALEKNAALIAGIDNKTMSLASALFLLYVQHDVEGGVVTDDFTVEKLRLNVTNNNILSITIDVENQPQMAVNYKGSGGYDLADRELRAKSKEIIAAVKNRYNPADDSLPRWDDSNVYLTVKNYAIGDTTSGEFMLVGEK